MYMLRGTVQKSRLSKVAVQFEAVELLNIARSLLKLSYRELSEILNLPESVLCRYANGELLPSPETAANIVNKLENLLSLDSVLKRLIKVREGYINFSHIVTQSDLLKLYARRVKNMFQDLGITKVLTAATDGIPLAVSAAISLDAELAVAKQYKDLFEDNFYETTYITGDPPRKVTLYLPKSMLSKGDRVLIVDDIVRTGRTLQSLIDICKQAEAHVVGISVLIALGTEWLSKLKDVEAKIDVVLYLPHTCISSTQQ